MKPVNETIIFRVRPVAARIARVWRSVHPWPVSAGALFSVLAFGLHGAFAQDSYPQKSVRWIAPVLAGGAGDLIARAMAPKLSELWGQQVIIDNRVGGGGTLGMGIAARMALYSSDTADFRITRSIRFTRAGSSPKRVPKLT